MMNSHAAAARCAALESISQQRAVATASTLAICVIPCLAL